MKKTKEYYSKDYKEFRVLDENFLSKFYKKAKQAIKPLAVWTGRGIALAYLISALSPKQADAQTFEGFVGPNFGNSEISIVSPSNDTVTTIANDYIPKMDAYYWACYHPNIQPGDTGSVFAIDTLGNRADTWVEVTGAGSHPVIPLYPGGYTATIRNIENCSDTLVSANLVVKHNGNYSDTLVDTFNISTPYYDLDFNLGDSDSVQAWANGNWDNLLGDSVFVTANALNYNEIGSSEGTIQRYWGDGDQLPDMVMEEQGVNEKNLENKVHKYNLQFKQNPSKNHTFSCPAYAGKRKGLRVYDSKGGLVKEYTSNNGKWDIKGLNSGVYFAVVDHMRKKFTVME